MTGDRRAGGGIWSRGDASSCWSTCASDALDSVRRSLVRELDPALAPMPLSDGHPRPLLTSRAAAARVRFARDPTSAHGLPWSGSPSVP
jgi:hypothetical protein